MNTQSDFSLFNPELTENERILMRLKPNRTAFLLFQAKYLLSNILRALPVLLVPAIGLFAMAKQSNNPLFFSTIREQLKDPMICIFIGVVLFALFFPALKDFLLSFRCYANTAYFLTDRRIITFTGNHYPIETSIRYSEIDNIHVAKAPGGTSSIYVFDTENYIPAARRFSRANMSQYSILLCLENAEQVSGRIEAEMRKYKY